MPPRWDEVTKDPDFQALSDEDRLLVKTRYFRNVISKDPDFLELDSPGRVSIGKRFFQEDFRTARNRKIISDVVSLSLTREPLERIKRFTGIPGELAAGAFPGTTPLLGPPPPSESPRGVAGEALRQALFPPILPGTPRALLKGAEELTPASAPEIALLGIGPARAGARVRALAEGAAKIPRPPSKLLPTPPPVQIETVFEKGLPILKLKAQVPSGIGRPGELGAELKNAVEFTKEAVGEFNSKIGSITRAPGEQITDTLARMIKTGEVSPDKGASLLGIELRGTGGREVAAQFQRFASTQAGRALNALSQAAKALLKDFDSDPAIKASLDAIVNKKVETTLGRRVLDFVSDKGTSVFNLWRSSLVSQLGTAVRNAVQQGARVGVAFVDDVFNGAFRSILGRETPGAAFSNALEDVLSLFRRLSPSKREALDDLLSKFPSQEAVLGSRPLSDLAITNRLSALLNVFNTAQEKFFRKAAFDARLTANLRRLGLKIGDIGTKLDKESSARLVSDAVNHALDMTFAAEPASKTARQILGVARNPLFAVLVNPFPRFWFNRMKFLAEHSPLGILFSAARVGSNNIEFALDGASKAMTGTLLFAGAWTARKRFGGERWYLFRKDPSNPKEDPVDVRNQEPLSVYAFLADFTDRVLDVLSGKRFSLGYSAEEISNALIAVRRSDWSGVPLLDNFVFSKRDLMENPDKFWDALKKTSGDFLGGFGVPFRNLRDLFDGGLESDQEIKDTRLSPVLGPLLESIPILREALPEAKGPTRGESLVRPRPGARQVLGTTFVRRDKIRREMDRLDIPFSALLPRTGDEEADLLITKKMGEIFSIVAKRGFLDSKEYRTRDFEDKRFIFLSELIPEVKKKAREIAFQERPDLEAIVQARGLNVPRPVKKSVRERVEGIRKPREGLFIP